MKKILKKINVLAIGAMIVGAGFAFGTINDDLPNVYFDQALQVWLPLQGMTQDLDYHCDLLEPDNDCIGFQENPKDEGSTEEAQFIEDGTFIKL